MTKFKLTGISSVTLNHAKGTTTSSHEETNIRLDISDNMDRKTYLDNNGLPTEVGIKPLTICFIQGLVANIHASHQKGWWDSADHLRYIIRELEKGFVTPAEIEEGKM